MDDLGWVRGASWPDGGEDGGRYVIGGQVDCVAARGRDGERTGKGDPGAGR